MDIQKITAMREGGKILGTILAELRDYVDVGMTKRQLDAWVRKKITDAGAIVSYDQLPQKFPGAICISVNDELVHGAPNSDYALQDGDKVSFDLVIGYKGYHTDVAFTTTVGKACPAVKAGIATVAPGTHLGDIGYAVETVLRRGHLGVIENYVGHFIGKSMHMEPEVPNFGKRGHGYILQPGDTLCIEPMSSLGKPYNHVSPENGWDVVLSDGSIGCHCEHTILVTETGFEVLTLPNCPEE